jgi:hypothetical protein
MVLLITPDAEDDGNRERVKQVDDTRTATRMMARMTIGTMTMA